MTIPATTPADGVTDEQIMKALEASGVEFMAVYQPRLCADKVTTCGSIDAHKIVAGVRALLALATPSPGKAPEVWGLRIGDSDRWAYTETESDADFLGKQSGLPYEKRRYVLASPGKAEAEREAVRRAANWLRSNDTGVSSETMAAIYLGADTGDFDAPHDPSDFGRCVRLVRLVPEVRQAFPRIAELVPEFSGILREWDALCVIFERDKPTGKSDELYRRIKDLRAGIQQKRDHD